MQHDKTRRGRGEEGERETETETENGNGNGTRKRNTETESLLSPKGGLIVISRTSKSINVCFVTCVLDRVQNESCR